MTGTSRCLRDCSRPERRAEGKRLNELGHEPGRLRVPFLQSPSIVFGYGFATASMRMIRSARSGWRATRSANSWGWVAGQKKLADFRGDEEADRGDLGGAPIPIPTPIPQGVDVLVPGVLLDLPDTPCVLRTCVVSDRPGYLDPLGPGFDRRSPGRRPSIHRRNLPFQIREHAFRPNAREGSVRLTR